MVVRSNLFNLLQQLERKNSRRYSWAAIGRYIGRSRQATENLFTGEQSDDSYIKYGTIAGLLQFFRAEGLNVTPNDLFTVTLSVTDHTTVTDSAYVEIVTPKP